ncbi:MAG: outer membrane protein assembly factor BamD [Leeuwenhoekiella sp.]
MFSNQAFKFLSVCFAVFLLTGCSEYQKVLKEPDIAAKYTMADSLYQAGKYSKSLQLFEQVVPAYRGKPQAERVMFFYADNIYKMRDYYTASYQFDRFISAYPDSEKVEEAAFKSAASFYELSPISSRDQTETNKALDKLQLFIGQYPESGFQEEAETMITELSQKIQKKDFDIAKQYNTIGDAMSTYPSAIAAFDDFISDYPGSPYREGAMYYKLDSQYKLAVGSLAFLVEERLRKALEYYNTLIRYYPEGEYRGQADELKADIASRLENMTT